MALPRVAQVVRPTGLENQLVMVNSRALCSGQDGSLGSAGSPRWTGGGVVLGGGSGVAEEPHGKVLDMGGPLSSQLKELDIVPLQTVHRHWKT